jgi:hypothetical protein
MMMFFYIWPRNFIIFLAYPTLISSYPMGGCKISIIGMELHVVIFMVNLGMWMKIV